MPLESNNIRVHSSHILRVNKDESFVRVKADSQNILDILISHFGEVFQILAIFVEVFFIISDLDHKWDVEGFLQILGEVEW